MVPTLSHTRLTRAFGPAARRVPGLSPAARRGEGRARRPGVEPLEGRTLLSGSPGTPTLSAAAVTDAATGTPVIQVSYAETDASRLTLYEKGPSDENFARVATDPRTGGPLSLDPSGSLLFPAQLGQDYAFRLRADQGGQVAWADAPPVAADTAATLPAPTGLSTYTPDSNPSPWQQNANLTWAWAGDADGANAPNVYLDGYAFEEKFTAAADLHGDHIRPTAVDDNSQGWWQSWYLYQQGWGDPVAEPPAGTFYSSIFSLAAGDYQVHARAVDSSGGHSDWSGPLSLHVAGDVPATPGSVTASDNGDGTVTVGWAWDDGGGRWSNSGMFVVGVDAAGRAVSEDYWYGPDSADGAYALSVTPQAGVVGYYVLTQANEAGGDGNQYNPYTDAFSADSPVAANPLAPAAPAPAAPTNLSATPSTDAQGNPQVNLVWDDNADNETGYTVERSTDGVNFTQVGTTPADQTDFADSTGLTVGTTYTYRVKATGDSGDSAYSNVTPATTALPVLDTLTATAAADSGDSVSATDGTVQQLYVQATGTTDPFNTGSVPDASVTVHGDFTPPDAGSSVLFSLSKAGRPLQPTPFNFSTNDQTLQIVYDDVTHNGQFVLSAGVDANQDGKLEPGEVTRTIDLTLIDFRLSNVTYGEYSSLSGGGSVPAYHSILKDDSTSYDGPQWSDSGSPATPICCTQGAQVEAKPTIYNNLPATVNAAPMVEAMAGGLFNLSSQQSTAAGPANTFTADLSSDPLPVKVMDTSADATWKVSFDRGKSWLAIGKSSNKLYVIGGAPTTPQYQTVLDVGCRSANGLSDTAAVVGALWKTFQSLVIKNAGGTVLTYWTTSSPNPEPQDLAGLMRTADGSCLAWAQFLKACLEAQGAAGTQLIEVYDKHDRNPTTGGFLVGASAWKFPATGSSGDAIFPYLRNDILQIAKIPAQGTPDSPIAFFNHTIVKYSGSYYDPSYGAGPFSGPTDDAAHTAWEDASIAGLESQIVQPNGLKVEAWKPNTPGVGADGVNIETVFEPL